LCAVLKVLVFSGCKSHPVSGSLQPVAIEATRGGNETVEAFEKDEIGDRGITYLIITDRGTPYVIIDGRRCDG
jgi:hypothetical protein